jgi:hypothetical protein
MNHFDPYIKMAARTAWSAASGGFYNERESESEVDPPAYSEITDSPPLLEASASLYQNRAEYQEELKQRQQQRQQQLQQQPQQQQQQQQQEPMQKVEKRKHSDSIPTSPGVKDFFQPAQFLQHQQKQQQLQQYNQQQEQLCQRYQPPQHLQPQYQQQERYNLYKQQNQLPQQQHHQQQQQQQQQSRPRNVFKVYSRYDLSDRLSVRTGYYDGKLVARISNGDETDIIGNKGIPSVSCVMLSSSEYEVFQCEWVNMISMMTSSDVNKGQFVQLSAESEGPSVKMVKFPHSQLAVITTENINSAREVHEITGRVELSRDEFFKLGPKLVQIKETFDRFPNDQSCDPISHIIFDMLADILLHMVHRKVTGLTPTDILLLMPKFRVPFFLAYEEMVNFSFSTNILRNLKIVLANARIDAKFDLYTYLHFCMSQISNLLLNMAARFDASISSASNSTM